MTRPHCRGLCRGPSTSSANVNTVPSHLPSAALPNVVAVRRFPATFRIGSAYERGWRRCRICDRFFLFLRRCIADPTPAHCPCCGHRLATHPRARNHTVAYLRAREVVAP